MSDLALGRIANLIRLEDDLSKLASLREQFTKEKQQLDRQVSAATELQIDGIMTNLQELNVAVSKLNNIKGNIGKVNQIYDELVEQITDYDTIKKMTSVNQFLSQVSDLYVDISRFRDYLDSLNKTIAKEFDVIKEDIKYTLPNLLYIHYLVNQARNFQDYLMLDLGLSDDFKLIVNKITQPLKVTVNEFNKLVTEVIISLTEAAREGNMQLVYKLVKIMLFEENADLEVTLMNNLALNRRLDVKLLNYHTFRGAPRGYMKFFYDRLEDGLNDTFNACKEHFGDNPMGVYDSLGWLEDELVFVQLELDPLFPKLWAIAEFIQNVYYNHLHKFTMLVVNTDPPAEDLMRILAYDAHYSKFVSELSTLPEKNKKQKSIIGEDLKESVLTDYLDMITSKMREWNANLMRQEKNTFTRREEAPEKYIYAQTIEDEDANDQLITVDVETEVYVLPDFKTPLTMLKEQADVAADLGYSKILVGVIENWLKGYVERAESYQKLVEEDFLNYMLIFDNSHYLLKESVTRRLFGLKKEVKDLDSMSQDEIAQISPPGLVQYLAALGNTYEINTDRLQDRFLDNYKEKVHSAYHGRIEQAFDEILTPSTELNALVIRTLVDIIVNDVYPGMAQVFTKLWYENDGQQPGCDEPITQIMVETIGEYLAELRSYCTYDIYSVTSLILLDQFIATYIRVGYENILHGDGKKIDPTTTKKFRLFSEAIGRDLTIMYEGLVSLFTRKDSHYLLGSLRAVEYLADLATCSNPMEYIPGMWENEILQSFYHCSVDYVRGICSCRKDMDKSQVNNLMKELTQIQEDFHLKVEPPEFNMGTLNDFKYN